MSIEVKTETWEYHFVGTDVTYKYNHLKGFLGVYSESQKKYTEMINVKFNDLKEFQRECNFFFMGAIINTFGLN